MTWCQNRAPKAQSQLEEEGYLALLDVKRLLKFKGKHPSDLGDVSMQARILTNKVHANLQDLMNELQAQRDALTEQSLTGVPNVDSRSLRQLRKAHYMKSFLDVGPAYRKRVQALSKLRDIDVTLRMIESLNEESVLREQFRTESDIASGSVSGSVVTELENLVDLAGNESKTVDSGDTANTDQGQGYHLGVENIFQRPIPLATMSFSLGSYSVSNYAVWDLFTLNPTVRAKLRNYAYLRGDMKVRFAISGSPFHYGRVLLSYQPYPLKNTTLQALLANYAVSTTFRPMLLNYLSQAPGAVVVDVKANQPVDISCPFISVKPMHRLFNTSAAAISDLTSYDDLEEAGDLYVVVLNPPQITSTDTAALKAYLYGWMEDVELGATTATQVGITTESKVDEREKGPVERLSSAALQVSQALESVPLLQPFALASSIALSGVNKISAIFGWSKPAVISQPVFVKNNPFQNGALTIGQDTTHRVVLDPKQELTVDPRYGGVPYDEMVIGHMAANESYLSTFTWASSDSILSNPIFYAQVSPTLCTHVAYSGTDYYQPTALAFAAFPFNSWRGTIRIRLEVVASAYHRGKLAIFYEPNTSQMTIINPTIATNKQYLLIMDLQEVQEIEFDIEWASPRAWQRVIVSSGFLNNAMNATAGVTNYVTQTNGYFGVTPLTALQSPDGDSVEVNVYISSPDLKVNYLTDAYFPDERVLAESRVTMAEIETQVLNKSSASDEKISLEHFGERPVSFRALLKRYATTRSQAVSADATGVKTLVAQFPILPRVIPTYGGLVTPTTSLFEYLRYAFMGMRGGMKKRIFLRGDFGLSALTQVKVTLNVEESSDTLSNSYTTGSNAAVTGTVTYVPYSNGGIEFEMPYYSTNLFNFAFADDGVGPDNGSFVPAYLRNYTVAFDLIGSNSAGYLDEESATAEDFTFFRFQGAPYFTR